MITIRLCVDHASQAAQKDERLFEGDTVACIMVFERKKYIILF